MAEENKFVTWEQIQNFLSTSNTFSEVVNNPNETNKIELIDNAITNYINKLQVKRKEYQLGKNIVHRGWTKINPESNFTDENMIKDGFKLLNLLRGFFTNQEIIYAINTPKGLKYVTTETIFAKGKISLENNSEDMSQYILQFSHNLLNVDNTVKNIGGEKNYINKYRNSLLKRMLEAAAPVGDRTLSEEKIDRPKFDEKKQSPDIDIELYYIGKNKVAQIHRSASEQPYNLGWIQEWFLAKYEAYITLAEKENYNLNKYLKNLSNEVTKGKTPITNFFEYEQRLKDIKFSKDKNPGAMMGDLQSHIKNIAIQSKGDNEKIYSLNSVLNGLYKIQKILKQYNPENQNKKTTKKIIKGFKKLFIDAESKINEDYSGIIENAIKDGLKTLGISIEI